MNRNTRIIIGLCAILVGAGQIWKAVNKQKARKQQQNFIHDLSNQQLQERIENQQPVDVTVLDIDFDSARKELQDIKNSLDSIGKNLEQLKSN